MSGSSNLLVRFRAFAERHLFLPRGGKIIAAVSGGLDSAVLFHLLVSVREDLRLSLRVAHVNHGLRGEASDGDEQFVIRLAEQSGIPYTVHRFDVAAHARTRKIGIEEAGREVRYRWFEELRIEHRFDAVATAHTADDNAETVLFHLVRGTGIRGLAGIPVMRDEGRVIRPLLFATRSEIEEYAAAEHIGHRDDASNASTEWSRNFLRHRILPQLKERINPDLVQTLRRTSERFRELNAYLENVAGNALNDVIERSDREGASFSVLRLTAYPDVIRHAIIKTAIGKHIGSEISWGQARSILDLLEHQTGSWHPLPDGYGVYREHGALVVRRKREDQAFAFSVKPGERYAGTGFAFSCDYTVRPRPEEFGQDPGIEYVDADHVIADDLMLRTWQAGDVFVPLGMTGTKKLSDFFVDEHVPEQHKAEYPVLESSGRIVWVCGLRIDDRFRLQPTTQRVLRLMFTRTREFQHGPH
jgi:tRNA(Ile)-lysidine synthase